MNNNTLIQIEKKLCLEKGIDFSDYESFFEKTFPDFNEENKHKYNTEVMMAEKKVKLFNFGKTVSCLAGNNPSGKRMNLEFNNSDQYHMIICIDLIISSANKFIFLILLKDKFIILNDIGICRISTGGYTGILKRIF